MAKLIINFSALLMIVLLVSNGLPKAEAQNCLQNPEECTICQEGPDVCKLCVDFPGVCADPKQEVFGEKECLKYCKGVNATWIGTCDRKPNEHEAHCHCHGLCF